MAEAPTRAGPTQITTTTTTIKTAGAGGTWVIVRSIIIANVASAAAAITIGVGTSNTDSAAKRIVSSMNLDVGQTLEVLAPGFLPLLGGGSPDLLYALCSIANGATITLGCVEGP
jgi:hypothetical protein